MKEKKGSLSISSVKITVVCISSEKYHGNCPGLHDILSIDLFFREKWKDSRKWEIKRCVQNERKLFEELFSH